MGVQRGSIVSVCAAAYELPTLGVDGSRSLKGYEVMAHPPTRNIQNVSVALYCAGGLPSGFLFQGTASDPQQREKNRERVKLFQPPGAGSSRYRDDGRNELDFQTALHVLVYAHMRLAVFVVKRPGT